MINTVTKVGKYMTKSYDKYNFVTDKMYEKENCDKFSIGCHSTCYKLIHS